VEMVVVEMVVVEMVVVNISHLVIEEARGYVMEAWELETL